MITMTMKRFNRTTNMKPVTIILQAVFNGNIQVQCTLDKKYCTNHKQYDTKNNIKTECITFAIKQKTKLTQSKLTIYYCCNTF